MTTQNMLFFSSLSKAVLQEEPRRVEEVKSDGSSCVSLTVWRKSLLLSCNGFTVIDHNGNLVYRVDNYMGRPEEVILMDGFGKSVLTMSRRSKKLRLGETWTVYEGEGSRNEPVCRVRKNRKILHVAPSSKVLAYVYNYSMSSERKYTYTVEGSYVHRSCQVLDGSRRVVAEVRRKELMEGGVYFGDEVFLLVVLPGIDPGLAMALVLILDQMFS